MAAQRSLAARAPVRPPAATDRPCLTKLQTNKVRNVREEISYGEENVTEPTGGDGGAAGRGHLLHPTRARPTLAIFRDTRSAGKSDTQRRKITVTSRDY